VEPGQLVAGKYRVESVLGRGGMGVVVSATHLVLDQPVAIKFLRPEACGNSTAVARILREARTVIRMETEHVARVLDCGVETDTPFVVMELLHGRSLARELALRGPLPVAEACDYLLQACDAIGEAHALGIVHRDLKPGNLFLARRRGGVSQIKVLDFGLSKVLAAGEILGENSLTDAHSLLGTPLYVSPEQLRSSKEVDAHTDVWALGLLLYQLITGFTPFYARSIPKLFAQIAREPAQPLRELRPDVPPELDAVVQRCLAKVPEDRFANAAELGLALAELVECPAAVLDRLRSFAGRAIVRSLRRAGDAEPEAGFPETNDTNPTVHEVGQRDTFRSRSDHPQGPTMEPPTTTTTVMEEPPPRRRWPWRLAVAAAVAAGIVALYEVFLPRLVPVASPHLFSEGELGADTTGAPAASSVVSMRLSATPAEARFFVDGHQLQTNPFVGSLDRSNVEHLVRVEAAGFEPLEQLVAPHQPVNLELHLRPLSPVSPAGDARRAARKH
jgi:serine/threonine protein kinase